MAPLTCGARWCYDPIMHEAADFPDRLALALADPERRLEGPPTGEDLRRGVPRRLRQHNYDQPEVGRARRIARSSASV